MHEKEIKLHELIDSGKEAEAIELLDSDESIDVNFEYNLRTPIFSVISNKMYDLFEKIAKNPKFDSNIEDGFGENLLQSLIYMYTAEGLDLDTENIANMIKVILGLDTFNFNHQDLNEDTTLHVACVYPKALWIVEALVNKKNININLINEIDCSALTVAIGEGNVEAIKLLSKRQDLVVREIDVEKAKKANIELSECGINVPSFAEA